MPDVDSADDLIAAAGAADRGDPSDPAAGAAPAGALALPDEFAPWRAAVMRYGVMVRGALPEKYREHWTEANLAHLGDELAACAKDRGWKWGALLTHPVGRLAAASAPLVMPLIWPYVEPFVRRALFAKAAPAVEPMLAPSSPAAPAAPPESVEGKFAP